MSGASEARCVASDASAARAGPEVTPGDAARIGRCLPPRLPPRVSPHEVAALSSRLARVAVASLYDELALYPKPGLVSLRDAGAHADMDARTFIRSIFALRGYFRAIAGAGIRGATFGEMKMLGIAAEARMLRATRGVNTHRGAIFCMGLACAAAGWRLARGGSAGDAELRATLRRWQYDLRTSPPGGDAAPQHDEARSHGRVAVLRHGVDGARGEAARAFPSVFQCALPALRAALARGANAEQAQLHALFALMAQVADTNVLYRGGIDGLQVMRAAAQRFLAQGSVFASGSSARAIELHRHFCALGLSPGGCADLLGVTCFVQRVQTGEFRGSPSAHGRRAPDVAGRTAQAR